MQEGLLPNAIYCSNNESGITLQLGLYLPFHVVMRKPMMRVFFSDASYFSQLDPWSVMLLEHFTLLRAPATDLRHILCILFQ